MPVPITGPGPGPSRPVGLDDATALMRYDANKRSTLVAYLLWFFLGSFGAHRFYAGRTSSGVAQLVITLLSMLMTFVLIGYAGLFVIALWVLLDAFLIPGMIRGYNNQLIASLGR